MKVTTGPSAGGGGALKCSLDSGSIVGAYPFGASDSAWKKVFALISVYLERSPELTPKARRGKADSLRQWGGQAWHHPPIPASASPTYQSMSASAALDLIAASRCPLVCPALTLLPVVCTGSLEMEVSSRGWWSPSRALVTVRVFTYYS